MIKFRDPLDKYDDAGEALDPVLPRLRHIGHLNSGDGDTIQIIIN